MSGSTPWRLRYFFENEDEDEDDPASRLLQHAHHAHTPVVKRVPTRLRFALSALGRRATVTPRLPKPIYRG